MEEEIVKKEESNNKNQTTIILLIIIALVLAAFIYFLFFQGNKSNKGSSGSTPPPTLEPTTNGISRKMVFNSCKDTVETFNGIKVEVKNTKYETDTIGCEGKIYINDSAVTDFDEIGIMTIEVYDTYVIIDGGTSGSGVFVIYDTKNNNKKIIPDLGKYFQEQDYISDDTGLTVIASSHAGEVGAQEPEHPFRKLRIKYANGSFGTPEIIEQYDEYKELVK